MKRALEEKACDKSIICLEVIAGLLLFVCYLLFVQISCPIFRRHPGGLFAKIIMAGFLLSIISFYFAPVSLIFKKNEREADGFAVGMTGGIRYSRILL